MKCYCSSGGNYADCCQPLIEGKTKPQTAEHLMRSRYSAYATVAVEYLLRSTHPSTRKYHNAEEIENWAKTNDWERLEIISKSNGEAKDKEGTVEFKAYFSDANGEQHIHHEVSNFRKELGKWFFVDGKS